MPSFGCLITPNEAYPEGTNSWPNSPSPVRRFHELGHDYEMLTKSVR